MKTAVIQINYWLRSRTSIILLMGMSLINTMMQPINILPTNGNLALNFGQKKYPDFSEYGYQIERLLGQNQAGGRVTYKAIHLQSGQPVVIKQFQFLQANSWAAYETYEREIQVLKQLNHPGIPRYLNDFETPRSLCLVTEYKDAPSLAVRRNFTPQQIKEIAIAVLEVLVYLQSACPPVIHRDIKPENILIDSSDGIKIYLVDFGFAHISSGDLAASSVVKGTLGFMPPEQMFSRQLTEASDLYSLGATLICLLTGTKSAEIGNLIDEANRINVKQLKLKLNRQFLRWLEKMVSLNLKDRYPNAAEALKTLEKIEVIDARSTSARLATVSTVAVAQTNKISHWLKNSTKRWLETAEITQLFSTEELEIDNLENADLRGVDFRGADLENANLQSANLEGADLRNANLQGANLEGANLEGANLENANLGEAYLPGVNLTNANLKLAKLREAYLDNANLKGANLSQANLWLVHLYNANLKEAKLSRASLWEADLDNANLSGAYLADTNLRGANLRNARLDGAYLKGVNFRGAIMPDGRPYTGLGKFMGIGGYREGKVKIKIPHALKSKAIAFSSPLLSSG